MALTLYTAPLVEPVALWEAKRHLGFSEGLADDTDDSRIELLITTARMHAENFTRRVFITQTWDWSLEGFPPDTWINLPLTPIQSITHIKYYYNDVLLTLASAEYALHKSDVEPLIFSVDEQPWPVADFGRPDAVQIRFVAGYGATASLVPAPIRQAILMGISSISDVGCREDKIYQPTCERLLMPFRVSL